MLKHIVMWKLKDEKKSENLLLMKSKLESLKGKISVIIDLDVGIKSNFDEEYDIILYSVFHSKEDLEKYIEHDSHKEVASFIGKAVSKRFAFDYFV